MNEAEKAGIEAETVDKTLNKGLPTGKTVDKTMDKPGAGLDKIGGTVDKNTEAVRIWTKKEAGIYLHKSGVFYERPKISGVYTYRSLATTTLKVARAELAVRQEKRAKGEDPQPKHATGATVGDCLRRYQQDGFPDRQLGVRPSEGKASEADKCDMLLKFWDKTPVEDVSLQSFDAYREWRKKQMQRSTKGTRITNLELNTLSNAGFYCARKGLIKVNVFADKPTYGSAKDVKHCRESMPANIDDVHKIARVFFVKGGKSEVFGWQILIEAQTGIRTIEGRQFRVDAEPNHAGWETEDGGSL